MPNAYKLICFDRNINGNRDVKILECYNLSVQRCVKLTLLVNCSLWWSTLYLIWNKLWSNVCWLQGLLPMSNNTITHLYYYCQIPFFSLCFNKTRKVHNTIFSSINNFSITWQSMLNWSLGGGFVCTQVNIKKSSQSTSTLTRG